MLEDIEYPSRAPRLSIRCEVEIRHGLAVWNGETEDVGPGGCRIVTPRMIDPGRNVKLAIRCDEAPRTLLASGRVAWVRATAPARIGVAFDAGRGAAEWLDALVAFSRRQLPVAPAAPALPEASRPAVASPEHEPPERPAGPGPAASAVRTPEVQRLYDEALAHIGSGRLGIALDRLRDALRHAPDDVAIASTAKRIARWT